MAIPLKLTVYKGPELLGEHSFDRDIIKIGRLASAHLRLDDAKVSRIHAVIEASGDGSVYSIIDMGSTEGTYLNGDKISKEHLTDGDELRIGDCKVVVSFEDGQRVGSADLVASSEVPGVLPTPELWSASPQELATVPPTTDMTNPYPFGGFAQPQVGMPQVGMPQVGMPNQQVVFHNPNGGSGFGAPSMPYDAAPSSMSAQGARPGTGSYQPVMTGPGMPGMPGMSPPSMGAAPFVPTWIPPSSGAGSGMPMSMPSVSQSGMASNGMPGMAAPPAMALAMHPALSASPTPQASMPPSGGAMPVGYAPPMETFGSMPQGYAMPPSAIRFDPWGAVPSNLASESVSDRERALEIKTIWGADTVIDTVTVTTQPNVTLGDERKVTGWGPLQKVVRCDIEVPTRGLQAKTLSLAEHQGGEGTNYTIHIPQGFEGRLERADGAVFGLDALTKRGASQDGSGISYPLQAAETLYLAHAGLTFQIRYVRRAKVLPLGIFDEVNYAWLNVLILTFFVHLVAIVSFLATPDVQSELTEDMFKNRNRFAQFKLTPEEKKKQKATDMLSKLKAGEVGAKAKGAEGKAGRPDFDKTKKQGRMAVKGDPNKEEIAKSTLAKLFGKGNTGRSYLFGSGGLGGELKGALGGVTGAEIGDAYGLGGLGTRGTGPGGGGVSMDSVGLGALGTKGRGGGGTGYGEGIGGIGKKVDRDINISAGSPLVMGSLDKEIIRRVIKQHIAQIRYCYEKELVRSPGLFGKVATKFVITAEGSVQSAEVTESTLNNGEVERCVTAKIRTWQFPKPKGGGIVVVKYPFIFKTTG